MTGIQRCLRTLLLFSNYVSHFCMLGMTPIYLLSDIFYECPITSWNFYFPLFLLCLLQIRYLTGLSRQSPNAFLYGFWVLCHFQKSLLLHYSYKNVVLHILVIFMYRNVYIFIPFQIYLLIWYEAGCQYYLSNNHCLNIFPENPICLLLGNVTYTLHV